MKSLLLRFIPKPLRLVYHRVRASLAAGLAGYPGRKLTVIAVTGTNGKTTVVSFIGQLLRSLNQPVGWISTATICIRDKEQLNQTKLTVPGPWQLQSLLKRMVKAGCKYAVLEASSEGLDQGRLNGVPVQVAVFTNLTPEHIESHGSFEAYARAKERLFAKLSEPKRGPDRSTALIVNLDDPSARRFLKYRADRKVGCTLAGQPAPDSPISIRTASSIEEAELSTRFQIDGHDFRLPTPGRFNVLNGLEAAAAVEQLGFALEKIAEASAKFQPVPGRLELIDLKKSFKVLVDYAPEPASMAALYSVLPVFKAKRIIHVFGSAGGGRDRARRPILGQFITERADVAIVTNEDPYDEPPEQIIDQVISGSRQARPPKAQVERIIDRRQAIQRALALAQPGDLVVVTGKACEQWIMGPGGSKIAWDDRRVIRELAGH